MQTKGVWVDAGGGGLHIYLWVGIWAGVAPTIRSHTLKPEMKENTSMFPHKF